MVESPQGTLGMMWIPEVNIWTHRAGFLQEQKNTPFRYKLNDLVKTSPRLREQRFITEYFSLQLFCVIFAARTMQFF